MWKDGTKRNNCHGRYPKRLDSPHEVTITSCVIVGLLYVHRGDDSLIHFCWKDRTSGVMDPNDDLLLFPDEAEFVAVPQCTTGRVFVLKFKANDNRRFFWMQEPDKNKDKDKELMEKVRS